MAVLMHIHEDVKPRKTKSIEKNWDIGTLHRQVRKDLRKIAIAVKRGLQAAQMIDCMTSL